ncbi:MAG: VanZ family protein [Clostridia bacterium]|nr:VanZ family protein [Clostridia bacterium]
MKTLLRIVLWAAVIGWMALIFSFSMETAAESAETSGGLIRYFMERYLNGFTELTADEQFMKIESVSNFVRKSAHFAVFAVLGLLTCAALRSCDLSSKHAFILASVIGALYAVSDEIHQTFVPGRAGMVRDVLLDTCGVLTGAAALRLILFVSGKLKKNKSHGR